MTHTRLALAAVMASMLAGPVLAQTAQSVPDAQTPADTTQAAPADKTAPAAETQAPVPDTGMKKTTPTHAHHHVRHRVHAKAADTTTPPAEATQR